MYGNQTFEALKEGNLDDHIIPQNNAEDPIKDRNNVPFYEIVGKLISEIELIKTRNERIDDAQKQEVISKN